MKNEESKRTKKNEEFVATEKIKEIKIKNKKNYVESSAKL